MIKYIFSFLLFNVMLVANSNNFDNSFITKYEYGKMLYKNPRGISCNKCHGDNAKGKIISKFIHLKNKIKYNCVIKSSDITNIPYEIFEATLDPKLEKIKKKFNKNQVCEKLTYGNSMPTYFFTKEELTSIYFYLVNKEKYE
ncbi:MAG: hypothetical protein U9Q20_03570 [Campylobacterota bacterium]|nr:hypothetical protein [Campylobacterota bacterium]